MAILIMSKFPSVLTNRPLSPLLVWLGFSSIMIIVVSLTIGFFQLKNHYQNRIFPAIYIDDVLVGGLTLTEAEALLKTHETSLPIQQIVLTASTSSVASSAAELGLHREYQPVLNKAWEHGRTGAFLDQVSRKVTLLFQPTKLSSDLKYDNASLLAMIDALAAQIDQPGQPPAAKLGVSGNAASLIISKGVEGQILDVPKTLEALNQTLITPATQVTAVMSTANKELNPEEITAAQERAKKLVGSTVTFSSKSENVNFRLNDQAIINLLNLPTGWSETKTNQVITSWANRVSRPAQNAEFEYDPNTFTVKTFVPHRNGLTLDEAALKNQLTSLLEKIETDAIAKAAQPATQEAAKTPPAEYREELSLQITQPSKNLASTNGLGIAELIGFGESEYAHSIPTRIHNVALAANRINYHIIKPGEEFSFNRALGDVSRATGYQPAYVIQSGRTVLGDGGGVCQVSTTVFRAVLNAGLPVTKRKAHSYRVSYYELDQKPGIDATVYSGDVDLRFINDTNNHVLILTETDSKNLYMKVELYGTSDGRTTQIVDHKVWDFRAAPAPVYIPDPALPPGRIQQVDWAASGVKASFKNIVKDKDGKVIREEEYYSNYIPWSAKFLRGV
jgi:vancomycin resistance protein YoaR